ncbi:uncharacterized protein LOC132029943 [Lycium ferocissimum]|uniref:uncharacterized protein LOC132029943 n=1 Tax=Lycium ferocissimum TaxID=112874 RepID=UPI0028151DF1|nr:uncharacterized protein LOC132029943 [Lycium ferocissimum]XP_059275350.1 uncharacterized protein LOC132029943 [Lycium ferocissimum]XP_059275351.1 uncharacterized protein LOC132029943 [Lycium ferocissimum]
MTISGLGSTSNTFKGQQNVTPEVVTNKGHRLNKQVQLKNNENQSTYVCLKDVPNCQFCNAKRFQYESLGFCCSKGSVKLVSYQLSNDLLDLYTGNTEESMHFRTCIRTYNNMFAFTSLGVTYDKALSRRYHGIYTFRVQGQMYHFIPDLLPSGEKAKSLQLYFYDNESELANRMACSAHISELVVKTLKNILLKNPYSIFVKSLINIPKISDFCIALKCDPGLDQRVYNLPSTSEVAGIWAQDNFDTISAPHIRIYTHSNNTRSVNYYYGYYDPLQYPLLFPYGQNG